MYFMVLFYPDLDDFFKSRFETIMEIWISAED